MSLIIREVNSDDSLSSVSTIEYLPFNDDSDSYSDSASSDVSLASYKDNDGAGCRYCRELLVLRSGKCDVCGHNGNASPIFCTGKRAQEKKRTSYDLDDAKSDDNFSASVKPSKCAKGNDA